MDYVESESDFRSGSKFFYSPAYNSIKGMENVSSEGANKTPGVDINVGKSAATENGSQAKSCPPRWGCFSFRYYKIFWTCKKEMTWFIYI